MNILEFLHYKNSLPLVPVMSQDDFESLPYFERVILTCNYPNCKSVISKRGMLCVEHTKELEVKDERHESLLRSEKSKKKFS
jgi:hypothetical protein